MKAAAFTIKKQRYISYLNFEKEVLQISQTEPFITKEDAFHIAKMSGVEETEDALLKLLKYYTKKGILLYYPQVEALQDIVFISPQVVADLVSTVIKIHDYTTKTLPDLSLDKKCIRFDKYGLLEEDLLDDILKKAGRYKDKETIIALLKKFGLAVEVKKETKFENEIPPPVPNRVQGFANNLLLFYFPDQFLSDNFFNHVLILIINWAIKNHHRVCRYDFC